ncbi:MAG TPA: PAS domain S-box protein [Coleofasciculaceae cyanobacterium]
MKKLDWFDQVLTLHQSHNVSSLIPIDWTGIGIGLFLTIFIIFWSKRKLTKNHPTQDVLQLAQLWVERTGDAIAWLNQNGCLVYVNEAMCQLLGYARDELLSMYISDIDEEISTASIWLGTWQSLQAQNSLSWVSHYRRKNGQAFPVEITGSYLQWNNQKYACCVARDISAYKQVEAILSKAHADLEERTITVEQANAELHNALKQLEIFEESLLYQNKELQTIRQQADIQRQRYQDLFNFAPDGYLVTDAMGTIQEANQAVGELLGIAPEHLIGQSFNRFIPPQDQEKFATYIKKLTEIQQVYNDELNLQPHNRPSFPAAIAVTSVRNTEGELMGWRWLIRDISEVYRQMAQRRQTEQIRLALEHEKELRQLQLHFFSRVSHEFRTPLSSILMSAQSLEQSYPKWPEEKIVNNLHRIQICAKRMTQLLEDILTINRAEIGHIDVKPKPINLEDFCTHLINRIQQVNQSNHNIFIDLKSPCQDVMLDENLLYLTLKNLLLNAVYYSPLGSNITLTVVCNSGETIFKIQDEGIGILSEDLPHIFEAFYRGKNIGTTAGTGLGMTVVQQCLDLQGGSISFESEVGIGTTVTVKIPDVCCEL